jgi:hypothetical protein
MPASTNETRSSMHSKTRSSAIAVCTIASGASASSSSRSVGRGDAELAAQLGQLAGVPTVLALAAGPHPHQLEVGVGVDAGDRVPPDRAGGPDDDAQRLVGDDL